MISSATRTRRRDPEVVSLRQRLAYTQMLRIVMIAGVVAYRMAVPDTAGGSLGRVIIGASVVVVAAAAVELAWRHARRAKSTMFAALLLLDAMFLAMAMQETGGPGSAVAYVVIVHVICATLVGSYRTGLKVALWHSLLMFATYNAAVTGLAPFWPPPPPLDYTRILAFAAAAAVMAIATAAFSAINERELRRRRYDLAALAAMCDALAKESNPSAVAEILVRAVVDTFDFRSGILLAATGSDATILASTSDTKTQLLTLDGASVVRQAWAEGATQLRRGIDASGDAALAALAPAATNVVVIPLVADGRPLGALLVEQGRRRLATIERRIVMTAEQFAAHGALALRNAWLLEQIQKFADTDGLTQVPNRRSFDARLAEEIARAERNQHSVALIMVDIDHFKGLNDTHGHQTGDHVLREVAAVLHNGVRDFDFAARYGGEEFALLISGATAAEGKIVADRLRRSVANADTAVAVTVSMGIAAFPANAGTAADVIEAADKALYRAKETGRNRVVTSRRRARKASLAPAA